MAELDYSKHSFVLMQTFSFFFAFAGPSFCRSESYSKASESDVVIKQRVSATWKSHDYSFSRLNTKKLLISTPYSSQRRFAQLIFPSCAGHVIISVTKPRFGMR